MALRYFSSPSPRQNEEDEHKELHDYSPKG